MTPDTTSAPSLCDQCRKLESLCVCSAIQPVDQALSVVILQHPQEQDKELGTAWMLHKMLPDSVFKIGLSWSGLGKILGRDVNMKEWGVLYLGTVAKGGGALSAPVTVVDKAGQPTANSSNILEGLKGVIVLDGSWAQAKTMWWRNAWLLKAHRLVLTAPRKSLYGALRQEPRKASLSTLEAVAFALSTLAHKPDLYGQIIAPMERLLTLYKQHYGEKSAPRRRDFRRRKSSKQ